MSLNRWTSLVSNQCYEEKVLLHHLATESVASFHLWEIQSGATVLPSKPFDNRRLSGRSTHAFSLVLLVQSAHYRRRSLNLALPHSSLPVLEALRKWHALVWCGSVALRYFNIVSHRKSTAIVVSFKTFLEIIYSQERERKRGQTTKNTVHMSVILPSPVWCLTTRRENMLQRNNLEATKQLWDENVLIGSNWALQQQRKKRWKNTTGVRYKEKREKRDVKEAKT